MAKTRRDMDQAEAHEQPETEPQANQEPIQKTENPKAIGYVYRAQGRHTKSGGQTIYFSPGDVVEDLSANEIMHFLANGIIEPRKG